MSTGRSSARSIIRGLVFSTLAVMLAVMGLARYLAWVDEQWWASFFPPGRLPPPAIAGWLLVGAAVMALPALFERSGRIALGVVLLVAVSGAAYVAVGPASVVLVLGLGGLAFLLRTLPREVVRRPRLRLANLEPRKRTVRS